MIYLFYASQGWTEVFEPNDRADTQAADHESAGYARAIQLYGTPADNAESVLHGDRPQPEGICGAHWKQPEAIGRSARRKDEHCRSCCSC